MIIEYEATFERPGSHGLEGELKVYVERLVEVWPASLEPAADVAWDALRRLVAEPDRWRMIAIKQIKR